MKTDSAKKPPYDQAFLHCSIHNTWNSDGYVPVTLNKYPALNHTGKHLTTIDQQREHLGNFRTLEDARLRVFLDFMMKHPKGRTILYHSIAHTGHSEMCKYFLRDIRAIHKLGIRGESFDVPELQLMTLGRRLLDLTGKSYMVGDWFLCWNGVPLLHADKQRKVLAETVDKLYYLDEPVRVSHPSQIQ